MGYNNMWSYHMTTGVASFHPNSICMAQNLIFCPYELGFIPFLLLLFSPIFGICIRLVQLGLEFLRRIFGTDRQIISKLSKFTRFLCLYTQYVVCVCVCMFLFIQSVFSFTYMLFWFCRVVWKLISICLTKKIQQTYTQREKEKWISKVVLLNAYMLGVLPSDNVNSEMLTKS